MDKTISYNNCKLSRSRRIRTRSGGATVEFIFIAPFLLWLTFAIIEWGMALNYVNTLTQLTRDGGRYAAVHGTEPSSDSSGTTANSIRNWIETEANGTSLSGQITDSMISVGTYTTTNGVTSFSTNTYASRQPGTIVVVKLVFPLENHLQMTGFVPGLSLLGNSFPRYSAFVLEDPNGGLG